MKIKDAMNNEVIGIDKDSTVLETFEKMYKKGIRRLFVFDGEEVIGLVSYSDLIGFMNTRSKNKKENIQEIMTSKIITINANEDIENAANLMLRADVSGLLVVENKKGVGVITKTDVCRLVAAKQLIPSKK